MIRLKDFIGNPALVDLLTTHPLPRACLFSGAEGVGKKTLALLLAARANCSASSGEDRCGQCGSCKKVEPGHHLDIWLFRPERNAIRIEVMRKMSQEVRFRPFEGRLRFFIVEEAEKLTEEAANSILKTLEEAPSTCRIILVSAHPRRILSTIRSRCQIFSFRPLSVHQIHQCLVRESREDAQIRATLGRGNLSAALSMDVRSTQEDRDRLLDLLCLWVENQSFGAVFKAAEKEPFRSQLKLRDKTRHYLDLLEVLIQDLHCLRVGTPDRLVNQDRLDRLESLSQGVDLDWMARFLYHIGRARWEIDHYANPLVCFETLWLQNPRGSDGHARDRHRPI